MKKIDVEKSTILGTKEGDTDDLRLGISGYFSNYYNFEHYDEGVIDGLTRTGFMTKKENYDGDYRARWYDYFIPIDRVVFVEEEPKKTYRPYDNMSEFPFKVGETITYRLKNNVIQRKVLVTGAIEYIDCQWPEKDLTEIIFSNKSYSPDELLQDFEYLDPQTNEWHPFGVEV